MFFFAIGALQWTVLESIVVFRYLVGPEMTPAVRPTLGLHVAPPAVAAATWLAIFPEATLLPYLLWAYAAFITCVLIRLIGWISLGQFTLGLWSFSFGVTALATGALIMLERRVDGVLVVLGPASFLLANLVIALLIAGTLREAAAGRLLPDS
jgi:tellurite resistance protein